VTIPRICRTFLAIVRTLSLSVVYVSLAIATVGIARAVWLLVSSVAERGVK
jgi:hypothetical protein